MYIECHVLAMLTHRLGFRFGYERNGMEVQMEDEVQMDCGMRMGRGIDKMGHK